MSRLLVVLGLLAAVALATYVVWPPGDHAYDGSAFEGDDDERERGDAALREEGDLPTLEGTGRPGDATSKGPKWPVIASDRIPRGGLDVFVYGPDLELLPPGSVNVTLDRVGTPFWADPLPREDAQTGAYRFRNQPFGKVIVRAVGRYVLETEKPAEIPLGGVGKVELFADRGGAIHYRALLADETAPAWVKLELRSGRSNKPVRVVYQTQSKTQHGPPLAGMSRVVGPVGFVQAIPPGRYLLHATSAEGAVEEVPVTIEAAKTEEVLIPLRY